MDSKFSPSLFSKSKLTCAALVLIIAIIPATRTPRFYTDTYPKFIQPLYVGAQHLVSYRYTGPRTEPKITPSEPRKATHIVIIIDESIRSDVMQIHEPTHSLLRKNTPFLEKNKSNYITYGTASSLTNGSNTSNYALMTGLSMHELPDIMQRSRKRPTLLKYAQKSGSESYFIWGQSRFLSERINYHLDKVNQIHVLEEQPNLPAWQIDREIIKSIDQITSSNQPTFTWINKWGCHYDYDHAYPKDQKKFYPTHQDDRTNREYLINSYSNCLSWSVDGFFEALYKKISDRDIVIVYTSDHGQSLMESHQPGTHSGILNVKNEEVRVPIILFGFNKKIQSYLKTHYISNHYNKMSSDRIFPTVLQLLGFNKKDIDQKFTHTLFDIHIAKTRYFLSGDLWGVFAHQKNAFD